ncbi:MAG: S41 family peptidase [Planctomycetota bacterium]|jgi:carboxyl-terminal processing protease
MPRATSALFLGGLLLAAPFALDVTQAAPAGSPAGALAGPPQELEADLEAIVARALERAADDGRDVWEQALALREVSALADEATLDGVLDGWLERDGVQPKAHLVALAARLLGGDPDRAAAADQLFALAENPSDEVASAAFDLFSKGGFRDLPRSQRVELGAQLLEHAEDLNRSGDVRISAAVASNELGSGSEKRRSRSLLLEFMASSDAGLAGRSALALASLGEEVRGDLEAALEDLAALPGPQADVARAYLKLERAKQLRDRKLKDLQSRVDSGMLPEDLARFSAVLQMVEQAHLDGGKFERGDLVDAAIDGLLRSLDEHSSYLSPEVYGSFEQDIEAEYGGIGAYVGVDPADDLFTITRPIYSGPAYKAGLMTDDKIVRVDDWPTLGEPSDEVIKRLKGKPGTDVRLYVWRRGMDPGLIDRPTEDMVVSIERGTIAIPAVHFQRLPGNVGLIELTTFSRVAAQEIAYAIQELQQTGELDGIVLDLRRNSGGLLEMSVAVADLFLPGGMPVVSADYRDAPLQTLNTRFEPLVDPEMPVTVLMSRFTASAAEIVSGALQDHGRATLVGERSFGKGSIQKLLPVSGLSDDRFDDENRNGRRDEWEPITYDWDGDGEFDFAPRVKLTIARYLLPSGRSIHRELDRDGTLLSPGGVEPDLEIFPERLEGWRYEELLRLRSDRVHQEYVNKHWEQHKDLFVQLAETDLKDTSRYPEFDKFFAGLGTTLDRDDVRQLLRSEIRRRVQDTRGGAFPYGDFQEDVQLQAAVQDVLEDLGREASSIPEFASTFRADLSGGDVAAADPIEEGGVSDLIQRLRGARDNGEAIAPEDIEELLEVLGYAQSRRSDDER